MSFIYFRQNIGPFAQPDAVVLVQSLPTCAV